LPAAGLAITLAVLSACNEGGQRVSMPGRYRGYSEAEFRGFDYSSRYLTMRDGVRLAVDLYLPKGLEPGRKIPTILEQTRYGRALQFRPPLSWIRNALNKLPTFMEDPFGPKHVLLFANHGYAWVEVDVRGSGASFGRIAYPWSPDEIKDGAEVVDWIIRQPWSDGNVGATGVSYLGESAEFLLANKHPAVKAIAPRFAHWDTYNDVTFPGGVYSSWFIPAWSRLDSALDRNEFTVAGGFKWYVPWAVRGFRPVDGDGDRALFEAAVASHTNVSVTAGTAGDGCRDDQPAPSPENLSLVQSFSDDVREHIRKTLAAGLGVVALANPAAYSSEIEESGAAIYSYDGWFDAAYARGAIARYLNLRNPHKLTLGPWIHGFSRNVFTREKFDEGAELLRFFDFHLKGIRNGIMEEPPVTYYTVREEKWKTAYQWPLPNQVVTPYYLAASAKLSLAKPSERTGVDNYKVDRLAGTGNRSRWEPLLGDESSGGSSVLDYGDRAEPDRRLLVYDTPPLQTDTEVTGHPVATLYIEADSLDGNVFAYLEDVEPNGRVTYVTEGMLRLVDRKVSNRRDPFYAVCPCHTFLKSDRQNLTPGEATEVVFDMLPTSYMFGNGHSIRLALAGADENHFANSAAGPSTLTFLRDMIHASRVDLPIIRH
jgi:uncharacterized protein